MIYHREISHRRQAHVKRLFLMLKTFILGQLGGRKKKNPNATFNPTVISKKK